MSNNYNASGVAPAALLRYVISLCATLAALCLREPNANARVHFQPLHDYNLRIAHRLLARALHPVRSCVHYACAQCERFFPSSILHFANAHLCAGLRKRLCLLYDNVLIHASDKRSVDFAASATVVHTDVQACKRNIAHDDEKWNSHVNYCACAWCGHALTTTTATTHRAQIIYPLFMLRVWRTVPPDGRTDERRRGWRRFSGVCKTPLYALLRLRRTCVQKGSRVLAELDTNDPQTRYLYGREICRREWSFVVHVVDTVAASGEQKNKKSIHNIRLEICAKYARDFVVHIFAEHSTIYYTYYFIEVWAYEKYNELKCASRPQSDGAPAYRWVARNKCVCVCVSAQLYFRDYVYYDANDDGGGTENISYINMLLLRSEI